MALATKGWLDQPLTLSSATTGRTGTRISPDMVAEDGSMPSHLNPAFVKRQALLHDPPTLPQWAPRAGRNDAFIKWQDALIAAEATLDIDINEQQPQLAHLLANLPLVTTSTVNRQQMDYFVNVTADAADMWQEDSNTLFDVIKASLVLDGPHLERDFYGATHWGMADGSCCGEVGLLWSRSKAVSDAGLDIWTPSSPGPRQFHRCG